MNVFKGCLHNLVNVIYFKPGPATEDMQQWIQQQLDTIGEYDLEALKPAQELDNRIMWWW